ncbi:unnamed protein product, partial [Trichobilharzia regenti]
MSTIAGNSVLSLQQFGLEGIMGQPNLVNFAAAASSVFHTPSLAGLSVSTPQVPATAGNPRQKYTRTSNNTTTSTATHNSVAAKRTRLEGVLGSTTNNASNSNSSLPAGARGQNLVSLVSATDNLVPPASRRQVANSGPARSVSDQATNNTAARNRVVTSAPSRPTNTVTPSASQNSQTTGKKSPVTRPSRPKTSNHSLEVDHSPAQKSSRTGSSTKSSSPQSGVQLHSEDILICGRCRRLFEQVDELISHKMAGCSLDKDTGSN